MHNTDFILNAKNTFSKHEYFSLIARDFLFTFFYSQLKARQGAVVL